MPRRRCKFCHLLPHCSGIHSIVAWKTWDRTELKMNINYGKIEDSVFQKNKFPEKTTAQLHLLAPSLAWGGGGEGRVESVNPWCSLSVAGQGSGPCRCHTCSSPSSVLALEAWPGKRRGPRGHCSACTAQPDPALRSEQAQPRLTVFQATHSVCSSQRAL